MEKFLIYLYPVFLNLVVGSMLMITPIRLARAGASPAAVSATLSVWALFTAICAFAVGRILSERNSGKLVSLSGYAFALCFLCFVIFPSLYMQFLWLLFSGLATALFCAPFQVFMKKIEHGRDSGVVRATALYSASWSFGMATGPFLTGLLWNFAPESGWKWAYLVNALLMIAMALTVKPLERMATRRSDSAPVQKNVTTPNYRAYPDLARYGWILTAAAFSAVALVKTMLPAMSGAATSDLTAFRVGILIALIYYVHSAVSLCLAGSRTWMFRPYVGGIACAAGFIGVLLYAWNPVFSLYCTASVLTGFFSGIVGFLLVFYSLVHPTKAPRYIAVNEVTVGLCGVIAPLLGGLIANCLGFRASFVLAALPALWGGWLFVKRLRKIS